MHLFGKEIQHPVDVPGIVDVQVHVEIGISGSHAPDKRQIAGNIDTAGLVVHHLHRPGRRSYLVIDLRNHRLAGFGVEQEPVRGDRAQAFPLRIQDLEIAHGNKSLCAPVPGLHLDLIIPGGIIIHMDQDPDQHPEPVKSVFPGIIESQVTGMTESRDLEEIADGYQRCTVVGIGFVPVDTVFVRPDGLGVHGVKVNKADEVVSSSANFCKFAS